LKTLATGPLEKMRTTHHTPVEYHLRIGDEQVLANDLLGQPIQLTFLGKITCTHCGRETKKSFNQGYCFPCLKKLAQCDSCIISPEKCHYHEGTCREPDWADKYCMQEHFVYLANSSGIKVGITRGNQVPTRWMDQGAVQALPIARVNTRRMSGLMEVALKKYVRDKTDWRAMLKGNSETVDLSKKWQELHNEISDDIARLHEEFGQDSVQIIDDGDNYEFEYPVLEHPEKVKTHNFDKDPVVEGTLNGIKGQYLILDTGVLNVRKFTSYHVEVRA